MMMLFTYCGDREETFFVCVCENVPPRKKKGKGGQKKKKKKGDGDEEIFFNSHKKISSFFLHPWRAEKRFIFV